MSIGITELYEILNEIQKHKAELDSIDFEKLGEDLKKIADVMKRNYPAILEIIECIKETNENITKACLVLYPIVKKSIEIFRKGQD